MEWGPVADVGLVVVFPPGSVAHPMAFVLDSPVSPHVGVQVGGTGSVGWPAGDDERELLAGVRSVQVEDVTADAGKLLGVGEVDPGGEIGRASCRERVLRLV